MKLRTFGILGLSSLFLASLAISTQVFAMGGNCTSAKVVEAKGSVPSPQAQLIEEDPYPENLEPLAADQIFYQTYGNKANPALVMIHGLGSNHDTFHWVAQQLSNSYFVITYDQRGHGRTPDVGLDYSPTILAKDLSVVLNLLEVESAHILGHSFGARTAMKFAELFPTRVKTLIVEDMEMLSRWGSSPQVKKSFIDRALHAKETSPGKAYVQQLYNYYSNASDLALALQYCTAPILFLRAERNSAISEAGLEQIRDLSPGSQVVLINNSSHNIHSTRSADFVSKVREFLNQHAQ